MNIEELLGGKPTNSVWDKYVPLITEKNLTRVYITDEIAEPALYNELCYALYNASEAEHFILNINTPGGVIDSAVMILDALKNTKAKTTARISGTVASAGTIITLACDKVEVSDHVTFMIHNYSGGMVGKGHEMKARQAFVDSNLNNSFKIFYGKFLSEEEMIEVINGKDLWMGKTEVQDRLAGKFFEEQPKEKSTTSTSVTPKRRGRPRKA